MSSTLPTSTFIPAILVSYRNNNIKTSKIPSEMFFIAFACAFGVLLLALFANWLIRFIQSWNHARQEHSLQNFVKFQETVGSEYNNKSTSEKPIKNTPLKKIGAKRKCHSLAVKRIGKFSSIKIPNKNTDSTNNPMMFISPTDLLQQIQNFQVHQRKIPMNTLRNIQYLQTYREINNGIT